VVPLPDDPQPRVPGPQARPTAGLIRVVILVLIGVSASGFLMLARALPLGSEHSRAEVVASHDDGPFRFWATNDDGTPVRWDPCSPIELVVNNGADPPQDLTADLVEAVEIVAEITGLDIFVAGETDEPPSADRPAYQPARYGQRWAPVLIAWADPGHADLPLREHDRGLAIPVAVGVDGDRTFVTGQIVLNRRRSDLTEGFEDRAGAWGATLLHELGHLMGLAHVDDPAQLMATDPGSGPARFGSGDVAGLTHLGAEGGCLDVPVPQHVGTSHPTDIPPR